MDHKTIQLPVFLSSIQVTIQLTNHSAIKLLLAICLPDMSDSRMLIVLHLSFWTLKPSKISLILGALNKSFSFSDSRIVRAVGSREPNWSQRENWRYIILFNPVGNAVDLFWHFQQCDKIQSFQPQSKSFVFLSFLIILQLLVLSQCKTTSANEEPRSSGNGCTNYSYDPRSIHKSLNNDTLHFPLLCFVQDL